MLYIIAQGISKAQVLDGPFLIIVVQIWNFIGWKTKYIYTRKNTLFKEQEIIQTLLLKASISLISFLKI